MLSRTKNQYFLGATLLLLSSSAFAGAISIDGTCIVGTCPPATGTTTQPAGSIAPSGSVPLTSGTYTGPALTFADGDTYSITYSYSASFPSGTTVFFNPVVTYTGTTPSAGTDTINIDFYQSYYDPGTSIVWNGSYSESIPLVISGSAGAGSSSLAQLFYYTNLAPTLQGLGQVQQIGVGSHTGTNTATLTGLSGNTLVAEFEFTDVFGAGTTSSASISSPAVPEPAQTLPLGLALLGVAGYYGVRRNRSTKSIEL